MKFFVILFGMVLLVSCGGKNDSKKDECKESSTDPLCLAEREQKQKEEAEVQAIKEKENVKFDNIGACLKAKKEASGAEKPTAEMIRECKSSI